MAVFIRVRDRSTGHRYDIDERSFREEAHIRVNAPKAWPDFDPSTARARPAQHNLNRRNGAESEAGQPAVTEESA